MRRMILWAVLCVFGLGLIGVPAHANENSFTFSAFEADYYLGADSEGRSTLKTVEKLTAEFPNSDQNHGIERAIPRTYDGHSTSLSIVSVKDDTGKTLNYDRSSENGNEILRIGSSDTYAHGRKTYVITYTQRDVTKYFADTGKDEFYWDTNGTQWKQPFDQVTARVHLSPAVTPTFTKAVACYQGVEGSTTTCSATTDGSVITAKTTSLNPGQNMTVSLGFTPGTWRGYQPSLWDRFVQLWQLVQIGVTIIGIGLFVLFLVQFNRMSKRSSELGTIVPEYLPPNDASVLTAGQVASGTVGEVAAQLIDLAVRNYVKVYQVGEKSLSQPAEFELEIVKDMSDLRQEETALVTTLFGSTALGTKMKMSSLKNNYSVAQKLRTNATELTKLIRGDYGLSGRDPKGTTYFKRWGIWLGIVSVILVSPMLLISAIVAFICSATLYVLTDKGLALERYVAGLKMYIEVAEKERLTMLQSPEGAEKVGRVIDGDSVQLVKLYERVLPYAVLLGQEKEWNKQLGIYYEQSQSQPDWYVGNSMFNAAVFGAALSDFSSSLNSYTSPASSSSGGSGGGGSSGGGGGGGGGGGW